MHKEVNYGRSRRIEKIKRKHRYEPFCEYFEIPYMTETDWELGNRRVPQYLLRLMAYKVEMERLANKRAKEEDVTIR